MNGGRRPSPAPGLAILLWACIPGELAAQQPVAPPSHPEGPELPSYTIPRAPAQAFLGTSIQDIARPTSGYKLVPSLLSAIDSAGSVVQGFALEIAPAKLFGPQTVDGAEYADNYGWQNFSVSLATARASGDSTSTEIALGARLVLTNRADRFSNEGRRFTARFLADVRGECGVPEDRPLQPDDLLPINACIEAWADSVEVRWKREHWNDYAVELAVAGGWHLPGSRFSNSQWKGFAAWGTAAIPVCLRTSPSTFCRRGQVLVESRFDFRRAHEGDPGLNTFMTGARFTYGGALTQLFLEGAGYWGFDAPEGVDVDTSFFQGSAGIEFRVLDNLWVSTGLGRRYADEMSEGRVVMLAGLRFNATEARQFTSWGPTQAELEAVRETP